MRRLTVLYDARCSLCQRTRRWLEGQAKYVELEFIAAGSALAQQRFPRLDHAATLREPAVIGDDGAIYWGAKAWLVCLWALRDYRELSFTLASPALQPLAKRFVALVSRNRSWFGGEARQPEAPCAHCVAGGDPGP